MKRFNILIITQEDPFYVRIFFEEFLAHYNQLSEIKGVVIAPTMGKKTFKQLIKQMYDFYGFSDFVKMGLRYAYYKVCSAAAKYFPMRRFYSIPQICEHFKVPVQSCSNINSEGFLTEIRKMDLDLIISVAAPQIFKKKLIEIPRSGCINIHNSKLPKYRGMLPNFWQMYHGEKTVGTTIHMINDGVDDGQILLQTETDISQVKSLDSLIKTTKKNGAHLMIEVIDALKNSSVKPKPNPKEQSSYFTFPTKEDVQEFRKRGYRLL